MCLSQKIWDSEIGSGALEQLKQFQKDAQGSKWQLMGGAHTFPVAVIEL